MKTNKFRILKDEELKLEKELSLAMSHEDELNEEVKKAKKITSRLQQELMEIINYKVFAKEGSDQVVLMACYDKKTENIQIELNEKDGGNWIVSTNFKVTIL